MWALETATCGRVCRLCHALALGKTVRSVGGVSFIKFDPPMVFLSIPGGGDGASPSDNFVSSMHEEGSRYIYTKNQCRRLGAAERGTVSTRFLWLYHIYRHAQLWYLLITRCCKCLKYSAMTMCIISREGGPENNLHACLVLM